MNELSHAPQPDAHSILFINEIDSFSARGREGKQDAYMRGVVNGLLTQLRRAAESEGVVVLAATNFLDVVDAAVIRTGRFDFKITVLAPDRKGIRAILRAPPDRQGEPRAVAEAEIEDLTDQLLGASGADIVAMMRQAAVNGWARTFSRWYRLCDPFSRLEAEITRRLDSTDAAVAVVHLELPGYVPLVDPELLAGLLARRIAFIRACAGEARKH